MSALRDTKASTSCWPAWQWISGSSKSGAASGRSDTTLNVESFTGGGLCLPFCSGFSAAMIHLRQDVETVMLERLIGTEIRRVESRILASCGQKNGPKVDPLRPGEEWGRAGASLHGPQFELFL